MINSRIGVMASMRESGNILKAVSDFGLRTCQICCWNTALYTINNADFLKVEMRKTRIKVTSLWAGWPGAAVWNFIEGPSTLGLVPRKYRKARIHALKQAADFASQCGIPAIVTHLGFIPENPGDPLFRELIDVIKDIAVYCKNRKLEFWFETGQETPVTMLRLIEEVNICLLYTSPSPRDS